MSEPESEISEEAVVEGLALAGIDALPEDEQEAELAQIGTLIFERAFTKFIAEVDGSEQGALEAFLALYIDADDFVERFSAQYPAFVTILDEEMRAYRTTLEQVFVAE